jgi:hypothetical protein
MNCGGLSLKRVHQLAQQRAQELQQASSQLLFQELSGQYRAALARRLAGPDRNALLATAPEQHAVLQLARLAFRPALPEQRRWLY